MDGSTATGRVSNTRLYAAAIAIVSGGYSILSTGSGAMAGSGTMGGSGATVGGWVMLLVGVVALIHGVVLLTPAADRLGSWSGPAMIAYAVVMLLNRAVLPMGMDGSGMGGGMGPGMGGGTMGGYLGSMGPGGGPGMVALALLMLVSGLVMTVRSNGRM